MHHLSQKLFLSTFDDCANSHLRKFRRIHFTKHPVQRRIASRLFSTRPHYFIVVLIGIYFSSARRMVVKRRSGRMQSFDVSSGCLRPNVKTRQAVARARDRNVNFGSWSAARVVCHGIDRRCSWQLEAALRGRGVATPSQSFSHFYARVAVSARNSFRGNARLLYSPVNVVRGDKPDLDRANVRERTACLDESDWQFIH